MSGFPRLFLISLLLAPLFLLQPAAARSQQCGDVDCNGRITATDALRVLKKAVGLPVTLTCNGDCPTTTSTTARPTTTTTTVPSTTTTTTTVPSTSTTTSTVPSTTTTAGPTTTTTLPQEQPCLCGADCPFVCPDRSMTSGVCVIAQAGLPQGQCRCTAICPGVPQVCSNACDQSSCAISCPNGDTVLGECSVDTFAGCLCTNTNTQPCP